MYQFMIFCTIEFLIFFAVVYFFYVLCKKNLQKQNLLLLISSYIFYASWNWKFLFLLLFSTLIDFYAGLHIEATDNKATKKFLLALSIVANLGFLGFFKYTGFILQNVSGFLSFFGVSIQVPNFFYHIILPAGISFYTFQTMCYTIDVFKGSVSAERDFSTFALYVTFFPQLVAGPIERAGNLLTQVKNKRIITLKNFLFGIRIFLFGCFKKVVIGDNAGIFVDNIFSRLQSASPLEVLLAIYGFGIQIYCDFSGYTDMARGCAQILGFRLMENFNLPYFSKTIGEFWRRWHISLSSWLRDYLYFPLGGSRCSLSKTCRNLFVVFLLCGIWHGARWTFVLWGIYHGFFVVFERILRIGPSNGLFTGMIQNILTFHIVMFGWLIFRCTSFSDLSIACSKLIEFVSVHNFSFNHDMWFLINFSFIPLALFELMQLKSKFFDLKLPVFIRGFVYVMMFYLILFLNIGNTKQFIYFQF